MFKSFATLCLFALAGQQMVAAQSDYCSSTICRGGTTHTGCGFDGSFHERCVDPTSVEITAQLKKLFLDEHNTIRNFVAGGGDPKLAPACRMSEMQWDDELASVAGMQTKGCQMVHDACRNTDKFTYSGQNLAYMGFFGSPNDTEMIISSIKMWYNEIKDTYQEQIDAFPYNYPYVIGHFTGMVGDLNTHVGCAVSTYQTLQPGEEWYEYLVTCNYANTNVGTLPIYESCEVAASGCTTGVNCRYANLCKPTEPIDPNNIWRN